VALVGTGYHVKSLSLGAIVSDYITASFDTLLQQSTMTAATYLAKAKREIDETFGEGYAAKNSAVLAAFISAASADMNTGATAKVLGAALLRIAESIEAVAASLERE